MEIWINDNKLDFTLEKESNAGQVVDTLMEWLSKENFFMESLFINEKEVFLHQRDLWEQKAVEVISRMDCRVVNEADQLLNNLETLKNYLLLLINAIEQENAGELKELGEEYTYIQESLPTLLMLDPYLLDTQIHNQIISSGVFNNPVTENVKNRLIGELNNLLSLIDGRAAEMTRPWEEGKRTAETLISMKEQLEQVPILFQQGKDQDALHLIIVLSELLSRLFRIISERQDEWEKGESFKLFIGEMNPVLQELTEALKNEDTILMGDLIEYEILDRLDFLPTLFKDGVKEA